MRELDNVLASYLSYRSELEKVSEKRDSLEKLKQRDEEEIAASPIRTFRENILGQIVKELELIETPIEPKMVSFECDCNKMFAELNNLGKLVEKVNGIDYKSKKEPLVNVCEIGKGINQLNWPRDVTVDNETGNI